MPAGCPGLYCWPWPLLLCVHLQMALATTRTTVARPHNQVYAYHQTQLTHCLACPLSAASGSSSEDPNSPWGHCRPTAVLAKDHTVNTVTVDPSDPRWQDNMPSWTQLLHAPAYGALYHYTHGHRLSSEPPLACEGLYSWSQSIKSGRCDCFFKYADTCARQQETENQREHNTTKEHGKLPVADPKEMDIQ